MPSITRTMRAKGTDDRLQFCAWTPDSNSPKAQSCVYHVTKTTEFYYNHKNQKRKRTKNHYERGASMKHATLQDAILQMTKGMKEASLNGWYLPGKKASQPVGPKPESKFPTLDDAARAIVDAGFKALALIHHPDKATGNTATMASLSEARKQLRQMLDLVKP